MKTYTDAELRIWASAKRASYRVGRLSEESTRTLESIPGWSWEHVHSFFPFEEARTLARAQGFLNTKEFLAWKTPGMPRAPYLSYKDLGWKGWGDFLGTGNVLTKEFMSYAKARTVSRAQGIETQTGFKAWKKPQGMPSHPELAYKAAGWEGWGDFLGTDLLTFSKARTLARAQGFKNGDEFIAWRRPQRIPRAPDQVYKNSGWRGWGDFLGTGNIANYNMLFLSFTKARSLARSQRFTCSEEFKAWKRPTGMPSNPNRSYQNLGWKDWGDFLGTGNIPCRHAT